MMRRFPFSAPWVRASGLLLLVVLACAACDRSPPTATPRSGQATLSLSVSPPSAVAGAGGVSEAFSAADRLEVRVRSPDEDRTLLDQELPFDPAESGESADVTVMLSGSSVTLDISVGVRSGSDPLFEGSTTTTVELGRSEPIALALSPIASGVWVPNSLPTIDALQETVNLHGAVIFASGDTIPGLEPTWSTETQDIVQVTPSGQLVSLAEGEATVTATYQDFSESVDVLVRATVDDVVVTPAVATVTERSSVQLATSVLDRNDNELERIVTWTSDDPEIASVDASGVVTGVSAGSTTIRAESEGVEGTAEVTVQARAPEVTTDPATDVSTSSAVLNGTVDPMGSETTAHFEWGPTAALVNTTGSESVGAGEGGVAVSRQITGLDQGRTYHFRVVAENTGGTAVGPVLSFETGVAPPLAPSSVNVSVGEFGLIVRWTDNSHNETLFRVERRFAYETDWDNAVTAEVGPDVTSYLDEDASPQAAYEYRVVACNSAGCTASELFRFGADLTIPSGMPTVSGTGCQVNFGSWSIGNAGNRPAGGFSYGFYLSDDPIITTNDVRLGGSSVEFLGAGDAMKIPSSEWSVPSGTFTSYAGIIVDEGDAVSEQFEGNNSASRAHTVSCFIIG